jgi:hypothetical protein
MVNYNFVYCKFLIFRHGKKREETLKLMVAAIPRFNLLEISSRIRIFFLVIVVPRDLQFLQILYMVYRMLKDSEGASPLSPHLHYVTEQ